MCVSVRRYLIMIFVLLCSITPICVGDDAERISKLEAVVTKQRELLNALRTQVDHERTASSLGYEEFNDSSSPVSSLLKKGTHWSGVDSNGSLVEFRIVSTFGTDLFLESVGDIQDRVLLRLRAHSGTLQLRSLWVKGLDCRQLRCAGSGAISRSSVDLKYSYTLNGVTKDCSVSLAHEPTIADAAE